MKKNIIRKLLLTGILGLFCLSGCNKNNSSNGNNSNNTSSSIVEEDPYAKVVLTEAGAARVNAAAERKQHVRQRYAKYSGWLTYKAAAIAPKRAANPGDELEENMSFEIYPSDSTDLNSLFLIGRTAAKKERLNAGGGLLAAGVDSEIENLIEISTNIPEEDIGDYNLNGQVSYINGSGNINHDNIDFDEIPYQQSTEFTMTYTYIKKGTAADTSPYSCQPSFNITKVDDEAPSLIEDSDLNLTASYKQTAAELKTKLANDIAANFIVNDENLTISVGINLTDAELGTLMETAITDAKAASDHHFEAFNIPFTVYTANASTDILNATVLLEDDIGPVIYKNGSQVQEITLNGGVITLPHKDILDAGISSLFESNGYSIVDEIEGELSVANYTFEPDTTYEEKDKAHSFLKFVVTSDGNQLEIVDNTTIVEYETISYNDENELIVTENNLLGDKNIFAQLTISFKFDDNSHSMKIEFARNSSPIEGERITVISNLHINNGSTLFEEELVVNEVNFSGLSAFGILIISSTNPLTLNGLISTPTYLYIDYNSIKDEDKNKCFVFDPEVNNGMDADHIYLNVSSYDSSWYYAENYYSNTYNLFATSNFYEGAPKQINFNYTLEQFKAAFNINY